MGILPQALINYITQTGGGFDREQGAKLQIHSMEELTKMVYTLRTLNLILCTY